jgi:hypothetical protein
MRKLNAKIKGSAIVDLQSACIFSRSVLREEQCCSSGGALRAFANLFFMTGRGH